MWWADQAQKIEQQKKEDENIELDAKLHKKYGIHMHELRLKYGEYVEIDDGCTHYMTLDNTVHYWYDFNYKEEWFRDVQSNQSE